MHLHLIAVLTALILLSCNKRDVSIDTSDLDTNMLNLPRPEAQFVYGAVSSFDDALADLKKDFKVERREYGSTPIAIVYDAVDNSYGHTFEVYFYAGYEIEHNGGKAYFWRRIMQFVISSCIDMRVDLDYENRSLQIFGRFEADGEEELILERRRFGFAGGLPLANHLHLFNAETKQSEQVVAPDS